MLVVSRFWSALLLPATAALQGRTAMFEPLLWFAGVLMVLLAAAVLLLYFRRRVRTGKKDSATLSLTLSDLRRQRDQGCLTVAEYEAIREILIRDARSQPGDADGTSPDNVLQKGSKT